MWLYQRRHQAHPFLSGFAHQGGINGVLNQEPCAFTRACIADAKAELEAEEKEKVFIKTCLLDATTEQLQDKDKTQKDLLVKLSKKQQHSF